MTSVSFVVKHICGALWQTSVQLFDQTHYHVRAVLQYTKIAMNIMLAYFVGIPKLFLTHFHHRMYLQKLGFPDDKTLSDNGSLVWKHMSNGGTATASWPMQRVTGLQGNASGNAAHMSIAASSLTKLWDALASTSHMRLRETVLVDFGCGTGFAILSAMTQPFAKIIGVELDEHTADIGQQNIAKMLEPGRSSMPIQCTNAAVLHMDMVDFDFATAVEQKGQAVLLYMYEPLWTLAKPDAHPIYSRVLQRAKSCGHPVFVAYFAAGHFSGDALPALTALGAELLLRWPADSLNFASEGDLFLYKLA